MVLWGNHLKNGEIKGEKSRFDDIGIEVGRSRGGREGRWVGGVESVGGLTELRGRREVPRMAEDWGLVKEGLYSNYDAYNSHALNWNLMEPATHPPQNHSYLEEVLETSPPRRTML